ncbi:TTLL3E, partial [Symbiodinium necroappetens]
MALASDYVLPPKDTVFSTLLRGLKTFSEDLQVGATDSSAFGYGWAQVPSAARIAAPQLLQPKAPTLALTLRTGDLQPVRASKTTKAAKTARETPSVTPLRQARRPRSAGAHHQSFQRLPKAELCQTPRQTGLPRFDAPDNQLNKRRGSFTSREAPVNQAASPLRRTLPPAKSCRQRSQKKLSSDDLNPEPAEKKKMASTAPLQQQAWDSARGGAPKAAAQPAAQAKEEGTVGPSAGSKGKPGISEANEQTVGRVQGINKPMIAAQAPQVSPRPKLPSMAKTPRMMEDFIAQSTQHLLSLPGKPQLTWRTLDSEADYRELKAGEYFNHFFHNRVLTTKAGLAQSLKEYSISGGINAEAFFPRCYDIAQKSERDDFVLDYRRSAALRIVLLHQRLHRDQESMQTAADSAYSCNETVLLACTQVLQRWCLDLDPKHLDEEGSDGQHMNEDLWDALVLYSELTQPQLCSGTANVRVPRRPLIRPGGGDMKAEETPRSERSERSERNRPTNLKDWPEFLSHSWGQLDNKSQLALDQVVQKLEALFPQWGLHGGWSGQNVWIVKPGTNSKGSGIHCMSNLAELLHHCDRMPNRLVQKYIERPLLLFSGRKFDIRQWVLVRSVRPLKVFMFSECYLRLCNGMYDLGDLRDRERHISNWQVNKHGKNVVEGAVVSLADFREQLAELTGREDYWEAVLLPAIKQIVIEVMRSVEASLQPRAESFELFGFDLIVDEAMKPWLLEVNLSPGCESRVSFLERMLARMTRRLIEVAVLGKEEPDGEVPDWIKLCDDSVGTQESNASLDTP